jgi:hypothetical protein
MFKIAIALFREAGYRTSFMFLSQYVRPELIMAAIYLCVWIDPLLFGEKTFDGLSFGLWLEFILGHAHTGTAVVSLAFPPTRRSGQLAVAVMSGFYLLFVGAISFAMGSELTFVLFLLLSIKRITMPLQNINLIKEVLYAFFKVMIFLLTAALGAGIAFFLPADIQGMEVSGEGAEIVPAWGVCYFVALYFYEDKIAKKYIFTDKKNGLLNDELMTQ